MKLPKLNCTIKTVGSHMDDWDSQMDKLYEFATAVNRGQIKVFSILSCLGVLIICSASSCI
jgi:hypothetical protein